MKKLIRELYKPVDISLLAEKKAAYKSERKSPAMDDLRIIFGAIDLTTLDVRDTDSKVAGMCKKVNALSENYPEAGYVAGICVYPVFIPVVSETLEVEEVQIVSVSGGFPSAQTFREVKIHETQQALDNGAREIDIVIPVGKILEGKQEEAYDEVKALREVVGDRGQLKVILESGVLNDPNIIQQAALVAMAAGADFIKTSTGKVQPAARPEDVIVMADTAKRFYDVSGNKTGIKPAGGISSPEDAFIYLNIVSTILGKEWVNAGLFRIGASRLANKVLEAMNKNKTDKKEKLQYF